MRVPSFLGVAGLAIGAPASGQLPPHPLTAIDQIDPAATGASHATITQDGDRNSIRLDQTTGTNQAVAGQSGTDNSADVRQFAFAGGGNLLDLAQRGDRNVIIAAQHATGGEFNMLAVQQSGTDNVADLLQDGSGNSIGLDQLGSGNSAAVSQIGNALGISITQYGNAAVSVAQTR